MRVWRAVAVSLLGLVVTPLGAWGLLRFALTDAGRGRLAASLLTRALPATFAIESLGMRLPARFDVSRASIDAPDGVRVVEVEMVHTELSLTDLLHGVVAFKNVTLEAPTVRIHREARAPHTDIEVAFLSDDSGGPAAGPALRIEVAPITVRHGVVEVHIPDVSVRIEHIAVDAGDFWVESTELGASAQLQCSMQMHADGTDIDLRDVEGAVLGASYRFATDNRLVRAPHIDVRVEGVAVRGALQLAATEHAIGAFETWFDTHVDLAALGRVLPEHASSMAALRGELEAMVVLAGDRDAQHFAVQLRGEPRSVPRLQHVHIETLRADGALRGATLRLDSLTMQILGAPVYASGSVVLHPDHDTMAGRHDLRIRTEGLPLRQLLAPWVQRPGLLPQQLSMSVRSQGRSLWPMTSEVDVSVHAAHTEAEILPGITGTLLAEGKLLTHPDCIEVFALRTGSSRGLQVKLQGMVPLHPDGIADILHGLHTVD